MAVNPIPNNPSNQQSNQQSNQAAPNVTAHPSQGNRIRYPSAAQIVPPEKPRTEIRRSCFGLLANQQDLEHERRIVDDFHLAVEIDHSRTNSLMLDIKGVRDYSVGAELLETVVTETVPNSLSGRLAEDMASQVVQRWHGQTSTYQQIRDGEVVKILRRR